MNELKDNRYNRKQKSVNPEVHEFVDPEVRKFEGELRPLMTEVDASRNQGNHGSPLGRNNGLTELRNHGIMESNKPYKKTYKKGTTNSRKDESTDVRTFGGELKPLMTEAEKADAQILELSYDFSCRIIRLYKYLNEGKLSKADRDIVDALGRQLLRSATSINANMNEAQHPQSDADFLSKATIALKEARESENWLSLLRDNGYLEPRASESLITDCARINKILITITSKVKKRLNS